MFIERHETHLVSNKPGFLGNSFILKVNTECKHFAHDYSNERPTCLLFQEISHIQT